MSTLLVSLGTSPAIVPEAFLLPGADFTAVHVLTTASVKEEDLDFIAHWFESRAPRVTLTITRVAGFLDFKSEQDHFQFEEVLYRWWLEKRPDSGLPHVCLSGGFKTMSAAMQKAAAVLGADEVFHVLCDLANAQQPKTAEEIESALSDDHLHWIRLGSEDGWPQLRGVNAADYRLEIVKEEGRARWVKALDSAFRGFLREIVTRSHNISGAWERIGHLPFPVLATWSAAELNWLAHRVDPETDREWIAKLPKVELHCHLGGFATHGDLLHAVRSAAKFPAELPAFESPPLPAAWPMPDEPVSLPDYMKLGDANGSRLLRDPGCLRRQCELLYRHLHEEQHVCYAEIRCSPANYASEGRSPWQVLGDIKAAFDDCMRERPGCQVNLIVIATRKEKGDYRAAISRHLALAISAAEHWTRPEECRVVGVDLAGFEDITTRAHYFREEFTGVHRCGLALTVHAGENDDAEGVWRAVFDLNARRLGHALHLIDSPELMCSVADRGIGVEMCPYANYQIKGFRPMAGKGDYPLKRYLDAGIRVTVNTDNIGISAASLTDNFLLAVGMCPGLTRLDLLHLLSHGTHAAFLSPKAREELRQRIQDQLPRPPR